MGQFGMHEEKLGTHTFGHKKKEDAFNTPDSIIPSRKKEKKSLPTADSSKDNDICTP